MLSTRVLKKLMVKLMLSYKTDLHQYLERFHPLKYYPENIHVDIESLAKRDMIDWMYLHVNGRRKRERCYNEDDIREYLTW